MSDTSSGYDMNFSTSVFKGISDGLGSGSGDCVNTAHSHYFKDVSHLKRIDVYRVLGLFGVDNPCLQHAVKKILCAGGRGSKSVRQDINEAIVSLNRALEMMEEDGGIKS